MSKAAMQALRIDLELCGPMVVPDRHPVMLDALLLALQERQLTLPFTPDALPIKMITSPDWRGQFVWLASALEVHWVGPATDRYLSRNALAREILDDTAIHHGTTADSATGLSKLTRKRIQIRQAERATAWCIGQLAEVRNLLARLDAIGAQRHLGFGRVRSSAVTVDALGAERAWRRPLPGAHKLDPYRNARHLVAGRASPPYWNRDLSKEAWWPAIS